MPDINFSPFPVLTTDRLVLRRVEDSDADDILTIRSDERTVKHIDRPLMKNADDALKLIRLLDFNLDKNEGITWAITLKPNKKLIGTMGLFGIDKENYRAEVGYVLHPDYYRKGITNEALKKALDYGFNVMKLHSVEAHVKPGNEASLKLLEGNGFVREAYFKENYFFNGEFRDTVVLSLLSSGFNEPNRTGKKN